MAEAKIEIKVGALAFAGEGDKAWLSEQLDKLLAKAGELGASGTPAASSQLLQNPAPANPITATNSSMTLAAFLASKNATVNQVRRFLATAEWLTLKGQANLTTSDVTKALSNSHQSRLGNPADCLNKNVAKGHCEKNGDSFYVTPEGRANLG